MQKIAVISGGTGGYRILIGLRNRQCEVSALVNVSDNGGHSGELRDNYGSTPSGDLRQCLLGLAQDPSHILPRLFEVRMTGRDGKEMSVGNSFIAGLERILGSRAAAVKEAGNILRLVEGSRVLPITEDDFHIKAMLEDGTELIGQTAVSYPKSNSKICSVSVHGDTPHIYREAGRALREADKIVICPGDLYGSIIPNFLVGGVREAIQDSQAMLIYVCNLVTKAGTRGYKAGDFVREIERYTQTQLDRIIVNTKIPDSKTMESYFDENSGLVINDLTTDPRVIQDTLLEECFSVTSNVIRHNPRRTSRLIMDIKKQKD
jgi:uncharacterized cofD-like protein